MFTKFSHTVIYFNHLNNCESHIYLYMFTYVLLLNQFLESWIKHVTISYLSQQGLYSTRDGTTYFINTTRMVQYGATRLFGVMQFPVIWSTGTIFQLRWSLINGMTLMVSGPGPLQYSLMVKLLCCILDRSHSLIISDIRVRNCITFFPRWSSCSTFSDMNTNTHPGA